MFLHMPGEGSAQPGITSPQPPACWNTLPAVEGWIPAALKLIFHSPGAFPARGCVSQRQLHSKPQVTEAVVFMELLDSARMKIPLWLTGCPVLLSAKQEGQWHQLLDCRLHPSSCNVCIYRLQLEMLEKSPSLCTTPGDAISALGGSCVLFQGVWDSSHPSSAPGDDSSSSHHDPRAKDSSAGQEQSSCSSL